MSLSESGHGARIASGMPSGTTHQRVEMVTLPLIIGGALYSDLFAPPEIGAFAGAYVFASLLLSPDLDLEANSARKRWGPLSFIWGPYARAFKHRGASHSLLFGPLTRLAYLAIVFGLVAVGLSYVGLTLPRTTPEWVTPRMIGVLIAGLYAPNVVHVLLDRLVSAVR